MDEFLKENGSIVYTLDCGTTSFSTLNNIKYSIIDIITIDHHISETKFPNIYSLINPNRYDENSEFQNLAAVGVTFLFLMALRKTLREQNFFKFNTLLKERISTTKIKIKNLIIPNEWDYNSKYFSFFLQIYI